jgi:hypothetical protein
MVECQPSKLKTCDTSPANTSTYKTAQAAPSTGPSSQQQNEPDLAAVVDAWPNLPEPIKAGILAMVKAQPS